MDPSGLPGGEGKGQFPGTGQGPRSSRRFMLGGSNRRFGRLRGRRVPLIMITSFCLFSLTYSFYWTESAKNTSQPENPPKIHCSIRKSDPFAPRMLAFINKTIFRSKHSCANDPALGIFKGAAFHLEKGHLLVRDVKFSDDVKCCFKVVTRVEDEFVRIHHNCTELRNEVNQTTAIQPPTEVILVTCTNSMRENYYTDAFQILQEKPEVEKRIQTWEEEQLKSEKKIKEDGRLSVIIFGMDAVSQAHFERSMPMTKSYLEKDLKAVRIMGYNKVGDNTFPNVMALLSGLTREEFSSACIIPSNSTRWDGGKHRYLNCPFIWNTFGSNGYRTAFFDDDMPTSLFNLDYYNGFADYPDGPTDYYGRPYALLMERTLGFGGVCNGPRLSFEHLLHNVKTMAHMFNSSQRPYINFIWASLLSHLSYSNLSWGDQPLLEALKYLHGKGHLNHTAFFLLSDHGPRGRDHIYEAMIENRMPLSYILLPPWFFQRYPKAFENLQWNGENSVASHFDMHKTLQDMLDLVRFEGDEDTWGINPYFQPKTPEIAKRGQSLFERNPQARNCQSAGIPPMWCLCHEMEVPLANDSFLAVSAAEAVIEEVNRKKNRVYSLKCETLQLAEIVNATGILVDKETLSKPECRLVLSNRTSRLPVSSSCTDTIYISVRIRASPHDPIFQAMMVDDSTGTGAFSISGEIVREDRYSKKGHCVHNNVRPYCICKNYQ